MSEWLSAEVAERSSIRNQFVKNAISAEIVAIAMS